MDVEDDAKMNYNYTPIPSFEQKEKEKNKILTKLLNHFRRWHDCTEHVQQAVKPLRYPRGGVLSPEGFQRIAPTKSIKKRKKNVSEKFMIHIFQELHLIYRFQVTLNSSFFL